MENIHTVIEIEATADVVWRVLTEFAAYPEWNPYIKGVTGDLRAGARLDVSIKSEPGTSTTIHPMLTILDPNHEMHWMRRALLPAFFEGEFVFSIQSLKLYRVQFAQRLVTRGALSPLFLKGTSVDAMSGLYEMNHALKLRAESLFMDIGS